MRKHWTCDNPEWADTGGMGYSGGCYEGVAWENLLGGGDIYTTIESILKMFSGLIIEDNQMVFGKGKGPFSRCSRG